MGYATTLRLAAILALLALAPGALAQDEPKRPLAVVELFTSQGCNSCPPADEVLADLARAGNVVALGYHVDYWDYLGWRDTLGHPDNTARQREYGRAFSTRSVYTPQAIINGRDHVNGAKRAKVAEMIAAMNRRNEGMLVDVSVSYLGDSLVVETGASPVPVGEAQIVLVYFKDVTTVTIGHGKNEGHSIEYWNAVSGFHTAGVWHGNEARIELPLSEIAKKADGGGAVLIQQMAKGGTQNWAGHAALIERGAGW
jgi:hypothetical protein